MAIEHMSVNGINAKFVAKSRVNKCSGYFEIPNLIVATKRQDWFEIFIHEYCHFLQYIDEIQSKKTRYEIVSNKEWFVFFDWVKGDIEISANRIKILRKKIQLFERDCDKRAVKLMRKHNLQIDIERYIQTANVYHLFYSVIELKRSWSNKKAPYHVEELVQMMPKHWLEKKKFEDVPARFVQLIVDNCL